MKKNDIIKELDNLSREELVKKVVTWKQELFASKLNSYTSHVKDHTQFKKLRKNIARAFTKLGNLNNGK